MGRDDRKHLVSVQYIVYLIILLNRKSMFALLHSDINSLKSGLLHLTGQPFFAKRVNQQKSKMEL